MTDPSGRTDLDGDSVDLATLKQQFMEAEQRLRELAQGAVELTRASVMLKKARMGIRDGAEGLRQLSERLSEYIDSMAELTRTLARTSAVIEEQDTGETRQRLERIEERMVAIHDVLSAEDRARGGALGGVLDAKAQPFTGETQTDEVTHGMLDRLGDQVVALQAAIGSEENAKALGSLEGRLSMVHGAVEGLQQIAQQQLSAQLSAQQAAAEDTAPSEHEEAAATKLDMIERGLAALHIIIRRLEKAVSEPPSQIEPGPNRAEVGQKLDTLARRLAAIQATMERASQVVQRSAGETAGLQLGLYPDLETALGTIGNDLRSMEALNIDMAAELRRSLGQEITRLAGEFTHAIDSERGTPRSEVAGLHRTIRWLLAGTAALLVGVLYLIFR